MKSKMLDTVKGIIVGAIVVIGASYAIAWTGPTATPPNDNAPAPINVSPFTQSKSGSLIVGANMIINGIATTTGNPLTTGLFIQNGKAVADDFCLKGTDAKCLSESGGGSGGFAFGVWNDRTNDGVADSVTTDVIYRAETDGIVMGTVYQKKDQWTTMCIVTDSSSTPTTKRVCAMPLGSGSVTAPVKKGDYWRVILRDTSYPINVSGSPIRALYTDGTEMLYWLPIVSSNSSNIITGTSSDITLPAGSWKLSVQGMYFTCEDYTTYLKFDGATVGTYNGSNNDSSGCDQNTIVASINSVSAGTHTLSFGYTNTKTTNRQEQFFWIATQ